ncbi:MAG: DUF721 domain-containing protein [Oligoflexia bacterium]|nr:DUF721 domain-containing protein [Oligoflexia bacterium]
MNRRRKSPLTHISSIVEGGIGKKPLYRIIKNWQQIVGDIVFRVAAPLKIRNNILIVGVTTNPWLQELILSRHTMLDKIKKTCTGVKDIQFILKTDIEVRYANPPAETSCKDPLKARIYPKDLEYIEYATRQINDSDLKNIFEKILKKKITMTRDKASL